MRPLVGATILLALLWRFGTGPFLDALDRVDAWSLAAATGLAAVTTMCCAWRWALVARGLGVSLPLRAAEWVDTAPPAGPLDYRLRSLSASGIRSPAVVLRRGPWTCGRRGPSLAAMKECRACRHACSPPPRPCCSAPAR